MDELQSIPPSELRQEPDGTFSELTHVPIALPALGVDHHRILRKEQLADLPREQRGTLLSLTYDLFVSHWHEIVFGTCIQGAVYELMLDQEPEGFSYLDGYLTVGLAPRTAHMHLCVGPHRGLKNETPGELAQRRQCQRASFVRLLDREREPMSWSVQLFNGAGEQMITFFLPSPFLDKERDKRLREPNYEHLRLWDTLRARYLGERTPQPLPRSKRGTMCGG
jgi:hypothetical protein